MEGSEPVASIVVATYNRADRLERLLDALRAQDFDAPFEVIIVDDRSTDSTAGLLEAAVADGSLDLRTVTLERNNGPAMARERGWRLARGAIVAFTDDDCRPTPGWLRSGVGALGDTGVAFVQGRTEPDPEELDRTGPFSRTIEVLELNPAYHTCNIFYRRSWLERIDGFDTDSFSHGAEDCDLAWRAIELGAEPAFEPTALVYHEVADLGPMGKLRVATRWTDAMAAFVRHPGLREGLFHNHVFWKATHELLARAVLGVLGLLLPTRFRWLALLLAVPYVRTLWARGKLEGGGPLLAPFYFLYDLLEVVTVARAAVRLREPML